MLEYTVRALQKGKIMDLIVSNIKALRQFHRLTLSEFAEALGVSEGLISMIESGKREPTAKFIERLCGRFHVKPDTIFEVDLIRPACNASGHHRGENGK